MNMLEQDTYRLATPEGRKPGTAGHRNALGYLRHRFAQIGLVPYGAMTDWQHTYKVRYRGFRHDRAAYMHNLIGVVPGTDRTLAPIVIGAHYDSVIESYCADDNASAVAVILDVAQRLMDSPLERDVVIAAFDGEEPPYFQSPAMGSERFVEDLLDDCHLAIIMDLIGHPLVMDGVDPHLTVVTGAESHPYLIGVLPDDGLPIVLVDNARVGDMSDHRAFRLAKYPFLFLSSGEWADYHQPTDTPDLIDYAKVEQVADAVEVMARRAAATSLNTAFRYSILDFEHASLVQHLGAERVAAMAGALDPTTDAGIQRVVQAMRTGLNGWGVHHATPGDKWDDLMSTV